MSKKALIILADGFEETEAIVPIDILKRAGVEVIIAGLDGNQATGAHNVTIICDIALDEYSDSLDVIILPGGPGTKKLADSDKVIELVTKANTEGKLVAAICAAPALVFSPCGILDGKKATCYTGMDTHFPSTATYINQKVVQDGNVITGAGPGAAVEFGLKIVEYLEGPEKVESLRKKMII